MAVSVLVAQVAALALLITAGPAASFSGYLNDLGGDLVFDCGTGEALTLFMSTQDRISKKRSTGDYDRQYYFSCSPIESKAKEFCEEFELINEPEEKLMAFQCPPNAYIGGVRSVFDSVGNALDRIWGIKCCRILGECTRECSLVGPINFVGEAIDHDAESGFFFTGIFSIYDTVSNDRVFYLQQCRAAQCGPRKLLKYIYPWAKYIKLLSQH